MFALKYFVSFLPARNIQSAHAAPVVPLRIACEGIPSPPVLRQRSTTPFSLRVSPTSGKTQSPGYTTWSCSNLLRRMHHVGKAQLYDQVDAGLGCRNP